MVNIRVGDSVTVTNSAINSEFTDTQPLQPTFAGDVSEGFTPLHTVIAVAFQLIFTVGLFVCGLVLALVYWPPERKQCEPFFILLYLHAAFWCFSLVVHHHLNLKHEILRINGYLDFYKRTRIHLHIPFHVVSLWNAIILVVTTIFHQLNDKFEEKCKEGGLWNNPSTFLAVIFTAEALVLTPFLSTYLMRVLKFNRTQPMPDVLRDDLMNSARHDSVEADDPDARERLTAADLLEKQADVIQFLRDHNARLSQKIVQLNAQR